MFFGAHMSTGGGVWKALQRGAEIGCDIVQIFVKNNMQWFGKPYDLADLRLYANELLLFVERRASNVEGQKTSARSTFDLRPSTPVFGHTGYLINLGAAPCENRDKSIKSLIQEIQFATQLGVPFLVMHPGAHLGAGEEKCFANIVSGLNEVFRATKESPVRIALENTAGQGSCIGHRIAHLAAVFDAVDFPKRLGVCLDTAHFFAAGYDIRTPKGWNAAIKEVDELIGLKQILAFHLNDSKTDLGSRVDRHEHIGKGKIGLEGFRHIVRDARFKTTPGCLETPKSKDLHEDVENLRVLRELAQ